MSIFLGAALLTGTIFLFHEIRRHWPEIMDLLGRDE